MMIKTIVDEDFVNYKKPSMFIAFPRCTWKCEKECGERVCQNSTLATSPNIYIDARKIAERYIKNSLTSAIVLGGLEPMDSFGELSFLLHVIRHELKCNDDIVIYTGYYPEEIARELDIISSYENIIVKFGRYLPNNTPHYDDVLGVMLASDNQYAKQIS